MQWMLHGRCWMKRFRLAGCLEAPPPSLPACHARLSGPRQHMMQWMGQEQQQVQGLGHLMVKIWKRVRSWSLTPLVTEGEAGHTCLALGRTTKAQNQDTREQGRGLLRGSERRWDWHHHLCPWPLVRQQGTGQAPAERRQQQELGQEQMAQMPLKQGPCSLGCQGARWVRLRRSRCSPRARQLVQSVAGHPGSCLTGMLSRSCCPSRARTPLPARTIIAPTPPSLQQDQRAVASPHLPTLLVAAIMASERLAVGVVGYLWMPQGRTRMQSLV
mmetsp:Transcript_2140/g.5436  ORF Transcript_2140/g.5436 Transcript_2140/m.5436 type:complete len:272 (+) Transcript_2140:920-1735(+)